MNLNDWSHQFCHLFTHTLAHRCQRVTMQGASMTILSYLGFSALPKDTLACRQEELFWHIQIVSRLILESLDSKKTHEIHGYTDFYRCVSVRTRWSLISDFKKCFLHHFSQDTQQQRQIQSDVSAWELPRRIHAATSRAVWRTTQRTVWRRSSASRLVWTARWWISISHASTLESRVT